MFRIFFAALAAFACIAHAADAATDVSGDITTDTTWSTEGSPYIIRNKTKVMDGATLTINPGVVVKFADDKYLNIYGGLRIQGTSADPVHITSIHDDSVGGDTEGDGGATIPSPFDDWGINFSAADASTATFAHVRYSDGIYAGTSEVVFEDSIFEFGYHGLFGNGSILSLVRSHISDMEGDAISFNDSDVLLEDSSIERVYDGDGIGLYSASVITLQNSSVKDIDFGTGLALYDASGAEVTGGVISDAETGIEMYDGSFITLTNTTVENCEDTGIEPYGSEVIGSGNIIRGNDTGIYSDSSFTMTDSIIADNASYGMYHYSGVQADVRGNWWGDASGPYHAAENPDGLGNEIYGNALFDPWLLEEPSDEPPVAECCSNVAFIPSLQATRFDLNGNRLWEPNSPLDTPQLYLDEFGLPETSGVATDGIIDEAFGFNIYKKFIEYMNTELVATGVINEWMAFPYDWRFGPEDIAESDILLKNGDTYSMADELMRLAEDSPTGKATIIAHSNGGLVAKALISKLEAEGRGGLVDKLILVASPQLGTPKAIAGVLHGDEQEIPKKVGVLLPKRVGRSLAEHMPSAFTLLPSNAYFSDVSSPVIEFDPDVAEIYDFPAFYGDKIDSREKLDLFLLGENARAEPAYENTDEPNVLLPRLLKKATSTQQKLDAWTAPAGMKVIQIAGWGLDTIRGIRYDDCDFIGCPDTLNHLDRKLLLVHDGDGTVVIPSAVAMDAETYYVNINSYNDDNFVNRSHADIFEVEYLKGLFTDLIKGDEFIESAFITKIKPTPKDEDKKLRFRIHSPISLNLYDSEGNHTGRIERPELDGLEGIEQEIPNSYYLEFGETKYAGADTFATTTVMLVGQDTGIFAFEIDEVLGDELTATTSFSDIPVIKGAIVTANVRHVSEEVVLSMDVDGDGEVDAVIAPGEGVSTEELVGILRGMARALDLSRKKEKKLEKAVNKLEKILAKEFKKEEKGKKKTDKAFKNIENIIGKFLRKGFITEEEAADLLFLIEQIRGNVVK